jgi:RNA polymerase sigma-70 factor (ECF subfamily)
MDEKQAIACLKQGDPNGLEALVRLHQLRALRAAGLITGDRAAAEDIVQNAFLRAAERIGQFDAERPFGPWFLRIVANDSIKAAQHRKRQVSLDDGERGEPIDLADPAPLPEEIIETGEFRQAVRRALGKLPPAQRAAIVMRYYLGMSEEEMTEEMDSPAGTVKWRLHAARRRLESLLRRSVDDRK